MDRSKEDLLRFAIIEYLNSMIKDGRAQTDAAESLEVAVQCLTEAFAFNVEDESQESMLTVKPLTLPVIFDTGYHVLTGQTAVLEVDAKHTADPQSGSEQGTGALSQTAASAGGSGEAGAPMDIDGDYVLLQKFITTLKERGFFAGLTEGTPEWEERHSKARAKFHERYSKAAPSSGPVGEGAGTSTSVDSLRERLAAETKRMEEAEALKAQGNGHLSAGRHAEAAEFYTKAIQAWPTNAVYYSNRAAAYTHMQKLEQAMQDCHRAIELKPDFSKAYSRLGTLHFQQKRYKQAIDEGYAKALELEPENGQYKQALDMAEERLKEQEEAEQLARAMGGQGEGDVPPELMGMMSDPGMLAMAENMMRDPSFMQMAQGMMSNPEMMGDLLKQMGGAQADTEAGAPP